MCPFLRYRIQGGSRHHRPRAGGAMTDSQMRGPSPSCSPAAGSRLPDCACQNVSHTGLAQAMFPSRWRTFA